MYLLETNNQTDAMYNVPRPVTFASMYTIHNYLVHCNAFLAPCHTHHFNDNLHVLLIALGKTRLFFISLSQPCLMEYLMYR